MPDLPPHPSLEHLKKQAKRLHKAARSEDADALAQVGPYFGTPSEITLQQAQLVIARDYGFSSWTKLKHHIEVDGDTVETTEQRANRFLDLVCLHYGPDAGRGAEMFQQAADILQAHPEIAEHSLQTAAAAGDVIALTKLLSENTGTVDQKGGPFQWTPLMYAAYARLPASSSYRAGLVLLKAGADPNAFHMWGGTYRFTVLTGIFGHGEGGKLRLPEHPDMTPFAWAILDAGANPNDSQGAYNRCFEPDDTHLKLMLEFGLKDSDPTDWWSGEQDEKGQEHRTMHFLLIMALRSGFADRARLLIAHDVDLDSTDKNYYSDDPVGYTPYQVASMHGMPDVADLIKAKGGCSDPLEGVDQLYAACMVGDQKTAQVLGKQYLGKSPTDDAKILRDAAANGNVSAVETMIKVGFDLNPKGTRTALHAAAWKGHVDIITVLLKAGADPKLRDPDHFAPALGHALHAQAHEAIKVLMDAPMDIYLAAAMGNLEQIDARLAEDLSWLDAPFARVRPSPEKMWANDWAPPLWYAAMNGRLDVVRYLLEKGADASIMDPAGRNIADFAQDADHSEIAELLRSVF